MTNTRAQSAETHAVHNILWKAAAATHEITNTDVTTRNAIWNGAMPPTRAIILDFVREACWDATHE